MSINYIIATYSGISKRREKYEPDCFLCLQKQLKYISETITNNTKIKQITIMKPDTLKSKVYSEYYNIDKYKQKIESISDIKIIIHKCKNYKCSYNQYIECFLKYPKFDYYITMEDDYSPHPTAINFDLTLLKYYNDIFPENIGLLCTWVNPSGFRGIKRQHAAISNSIISKDTLDKINLNKYTDIFIGQMEFSNIFLNNKIKLKDYSNQGKNYQIPYWRTNGGYIWEFSKFKNNKYLLVPIQLLDNKYKIVHYFK